MKRTPPLRFWTCGRAWQGQLGPAGDGTGVERGEQPSAVLKRPVVGRPHHQAVARRATGEEAEDVALPVGDMGDLGRASARP